MRLKFFCISYFLINFLINGSILLTIVEKGDYKRFYDLDHLETETQ